MEQSQSRGAVMPSATQPCFAVCTGVEGSPSTYHLYFTYDASGTPLSVKFSGTDYYYVTNIQGDIMAILNTSGSAVVSYTYDAWGKLYSTTGTLADTLGEVNPLTYRGYVYDHDSGYYYLQSRYYNPDMGRFINADGLVTTGQGLLGNNMFAYANNSVVVLCDPAGSSVAGAIIGGLSSGIITAVTGGSLTEIIVDTALGAVAGGVGGPLATAINLFNAGRTYVKCLANGHSAGEALLYAGASYALTYVSGENANKLLGGAMDSLTVGAVDATFVFAANLSAAVTTNAIQQETQQEYKPATMKVYLSGVGGGPRNGYVRSN